MYAYTYMLAVKEARYDSAGGCFVLVIFAVTAAACCLLYVSAAEFFLFFQAPTLHACLLESVVYYQAGGVSVYNRRYVLWLRSGRRVFSAERACYYEYV